jgi:hypothetical protein
MCASLFADHVGRGNGLLHEVGCARFLLSNDGELQRTCCADCAAHHPIRIEVSDKLVTEQNPGQRARRQSGIVSMGGSHTRAKSQRLRHSQQRPPDPPPHRFPSRTSPHQAYSRMILFRENVVGQTREEEPLGCFYNQGLIEAFDSNGGRQLRKQTTAHRASRRSVCGRPSWLFIYQSL